MASGAATGERRRVQSIEVGFRVLQALRLAEGPLPLREIAAAAEMPPSKAHLYLVSFVREGMAYQDARNGHYGLGPFAIQLGLAAIRQLDVVELAAEEVRLLRDKSDCAVYLSLWGDRGPCIISKADGIRQGAFSIRLGYVLPMRKAATGLVFLAYLSEEQTRRALSVDETFAPFPISEEEKQSLAARLVEVRANGYAVTTGSLNTNLSAISAPIFDYAGEISAALTILGPDDHLSGRRMRQVTDYMLEATNRISARLGAAVPAEPARRRSRHLATG